MRVDGEDLDVVQVVAIVLIVVGMLALVALFVYAAVMLLTR